jgi:hypothetical protein
MAEVVDNLMSARLSQVRSRQRIPGIMNDVAEFPPSRRERAVLIAFTDCL